MGNENQILKFDNGRIPKIRFGSEFEDWPDGRKITYLKELSSSMNHAADLLQKERNLLLEKVSRLEEQVKNADESLLIQKGIVITNITASNEERQSFIEKIRDLQGRAKKDAQTIEDLRR